MYFDKNIYGGPSLDNYYTTNFDIQCAVKPSNLTQPLQVNEKYVSKASFDKNKLNGIVSGNAFLPRKNFPLDVQLKNTQTQELKYEQITPEQFNQMLPPKFQKKEVQEFIPSMTNTANNFDVFQKNTLQGKDYNIWKDNQMERFKQFL